MCEEANKSCIGGGGGVCFFGGCFLSCFFFLTAFPVILKSWQFLTIFYEAFD